MDEITIILFVGALAVYIARYFVRAQSMEYLSMSVSLMAMLAALTDEGLDSVRVLFFFFPALLMTMMSALSLARRGRRW